MNKGKLTRELQEGGADAEELAQALEFHRVFSPCLKRNRASGRFDTDDGDKTALGLFRTAQRYAKPTPTLTETTKERQALLFTAQAIAQKVDDAFDAAIKAQFGKDKNRFDPKPADYNTATLAAYRSKVSADEMCHYLTVFMREAEKS